MMRLSVLWCFVALAGCGQPAMQDESKLTDFADLQRFPLSPHPDVTPGSLCDHADEYRYPAHIKYCERKVATSIKRAVKANYDRTFGYRTTELPRSKFKIDHYISLCLGGSNSESNLWPQHESVYKLTDPIEAKLCRLLAMGQIEQAEAVETIKAVKSDLHKVPTINEQLDKMLE